MRGEHSLFSHPIPYERGSSPHARGTQAVAVESVLLPGIIPACAGNTSTSGSFGVRSGDHPRMRGEHLGLCWFCVGCGGSSPHARGTPSTTALRWHWPRIIPACAGNTSCRTCCWRWTWDHPRMRGEHQTNLNNQQSTQGSSPHARGTPSGRWTSEPPDWIIPACAGNTRWRPAGKA